ncbi:outer membrane cobalamin receptor [Herbaspirillum rubrisubalbicans]|uniref:TonB-dependent receptor plug domain-containing protein n=1 Tax=Herbaspirillum rubrisubalbicans TaxID=80842 RepID=UPI00209E38C5|nr:outer membrane cobalamin receptor [Herbaspirillum rubrisubalbicans]
MSIAAFPVRHDGPRPRFVLRTTTALILSTLIPACWAGASAPTADPTQPLSVVVVSASRFPNDPAFAPVAATVITAEQIREAGIDNANEAIRKLGGVYGRQSIAGPQDFPLDLRGFGTNGDQNMVVLVDGVRISENELSTPLLSSIPIESIERIEIVRGGSSVLYGSGATGGTIQIITRRPQANAGHGTLLGEVGSHGLRAGPGGALACLGQHVHRHQLCQVARRQLARQQPRQPGKLRDHGAMVRQRLALRSARQPGTCRFRPAWQPEPGTI